MKSKTKRPRLFRVVFLEFMKATTRKELLSLSTINSPAGQQIRCLYCTVEGGRYITVSTQYPPLDRLGHYSRVRERMNIDGVESEAAIYSINDNACLLSINASNTDKEKAEV